MREYLGVVYEGGSWETWSTKKALVMLIHFFNSLIYFQMYVYRCACLFICIPCVCSTHGGRNEVLDPLALEL